MTQNVPNLVIHTHPLQALCIEPGRQVLEHDGVVEQHLLVEGEVVHAVSRRVGCYGLGDFSEEGGMGEGCWRS